MKRLIFKNWRVVILFLSSIFIIWPLFVGGFFSHHDYMQIIRVFDVRRCLLDLQIPCRWVPDLGYGYGFPMFNYYGVFPYYLGSVLSFLLGYIASAKFLFFLPLAFGGFFVYLLTKDLFGEDAGFLAGILYTFAPYRALDSYVRGAITELFAITLIPLVLYFYRRLIKKYSISNFLGATISLAIFFLNHNIITMFFVPILLFWLLTCFYQEGPRNVKKVITSLMLGFGLAAFFLLPAYFEKNLVQIENLKESEYIPNFRAHFVTLKQLFLSRFWGYGFSTWLDIDTISFQVGWPHWWLAALSAVFSFILFILRVFKRNIGLIKEKFNIIDLGFFFIVLIVSLFMTHNRSAFVWEAIDQLQFAQFPWRFLGISIFAVSVLGGFSILIFPKKIRPFILIVLLILSVYFNFDYFKPDVFYKDLKDKDYLSGQLWKGQQEGAILDYLPEGAKVPTEIAPNSPLVTSGKAEINKFLKRSNYWRYEADVQSESVIATPVFDFPKWEVYVNKQSVKKYQSDDSQTGLISVKLGPGKHLVEGRLKNTPLRTIANIISLLSALTLIGFFKYGKNRKDYR